MHFSVLVLLKKGEDLEQVLAPFNSNEGVAEHDEKCWCISSEARADVAKQLNFEKNVRDAYHKGLPEIEKTDPKWRQMVSEFREAELGFLKAHPKFGKPDKTCSQCKGKGFYPSTSNENGHWDWYEEGGRWDGSLSNRKGKKVNRLKVKDYSKEQAELAAHRDCVKGWEEIQEVLKKESKESQTLNWTHGYQGEKTFQEYAINHKPNELSAYAYVSNGEWLAHERFDVETYQHVQIEGWQEKLNEAIKALAPDDELVMVDCHN